MDAPGIPAEDASELVSYLLGAIRSYSQTPTNCTRQLWTGDNHEESYNITCKKSGQFLGIIGLSEEHGILRLVNFGKSLTSDELASIGSLSATGINRAVTSIAHTGFTVLIHTPALCRVLV